MKNMISFKYKKKELHICNFFISSDSANLDASLYDLTSWTRTQTQHIQCLYHKPFSHQWLLDIRVANCIHRLMLSMYF